MFVTLAAIKLARTEDELAFLIGHELAHNIFHYNYKKGTEANSLAINYLDMPRLKNLNSFFLFSTHSKETEADLKGVEIALMIHEKSEESCRINFRSKGNVIVNDIAKKLGGGGHAFAAGAMVPGTLGDVSEKVLEATISSIKKKINGKNI